ncbi:methylated-DNA--[protein]-cysteine S-methyltransferase [Ornithinibacillus salinisoli]|uniref:Methylated-DNA--protein-cysteine methyltransferase n=1 Tax=Ornithinibacillus salinisoli TaxID=1848459 RepID=A0ABW4VWB2_9BACI
MDKHLYYGEMESPIGTILVISNGENIVRIDFGSMAVMKEKLEVWTRRYIGEINFVCKPEKVQHVIDQLNDYFLRQKKEFTINFDFYGTPFQKKVWQALYDHIPFGITKSYKDIAETIGNPKAVRAVGGAVNKNPFSIIVPCHRVIGANGKMVGYNGGLDKKEFLLAHEFAK